MRRIALTRRYHEMAWQGAKRATVRRGRLHVEPGERVLLTSGRRTPLVAEVERVSFVLWRGLTIADALREGFTSVDELREALAEFYPDLEGDALLTIVAFRPDWEATRGIDRRGRAARAASPAP